MGDEITLSKEAEAALDAVWDKIDQDTKEKPKAEKPKPDKK